MRTPSIPEDRDEALYLVKSGLWKNEFVMSEILKRAVSDRGLK